MKGTVLTRLSDRYLAELRTHLGQNLQKDLKSAHELGSQALAIGLETLDLAKMHDQALAALVLPDCTSSNRDAMNIKATVFFTEANIPIERTHRVALETGASLKRLNATLAQHALRLAKSNRELTLHTENRKTTEAALKTSEEASRKLLKESLLIEKRLRETTHSILSANEEERRKVSLELQDEIAQTLLGIHVRLLALKAEASSNHTGLSKEIATTQQLVEDSVKNLNQFARELGIPHEN